VGSAPTASLRRVKYVTDSVLPNGQSLTKESYHTSGFAGPNTASSDNSSDVSDGDWECSCLSGDACGVAQSDACDCVASFGNFYSSGPGAQLLDLDALPERLPLIECGSCSCDGNCRNRVTQSGVSATVNTDDCSGTRVVLYSFDPCGAAEREFHFPIRWRIPHLGRGEIPMG